MPLTVFYCLRSNYEGLGIKIPSSKYIQAVPFRTKGRVRNAEQPDDLCLGTLLPVVQEISQMSRKTFWVYV